MVPFSISIITWFSFRVIVELSASSVTNASISGSLITTSSVATPPIDKEMGVVSITGAVEVEDCAKTLFSAVGAETNDGWLTERDCTNSWVTVLGVRTMLLSLVTTRGEEEDDGRHAVSPNRLADEVVLREADEGMDDVTVSVVLVIAEVTPSIRTTGSSVTTSSETTSSDTISSTPTSPPSSKKWAPVSSDTVA